MNYFKNTYEQEEINKIFKDSQMVVSREQLNNWYTLGWCNAINTLYQLAKKYENITISDFDSTLDSLIKRSDLTTSKYLHLIKNDKWDSKVE